MLTGVETRTSSPIRFGMMVSAAPAVGALAGFAVLGERLAPAQWVAIALVILASAGSAWSAERAA